MQTVRTVQVKLRSVVSPGWSMGWMRSCSLTVAQGIILYSRFSTYEKLK